MNKSGFAEEAPTGDNPVARQAWVRPELKALAAGLAENVPGTAFQDGQLETIGS